MATSDGFMCDVCQHQNMSRSADYWCSVCDEGFCSSCDDHHRSSHNEKVPDLSSTVSRSVSVETSPISMMLIAEEEKQGQIVSSVQPRSPESFENVNLILESKFKVPKGKMVNVTILGCGFLANGEIILTDADDHRIMIFKENGVLAKSITLPISTINDITVIDDRTVAVSTFCGIRLFDIEMKKNLKVIEIRGGVHGIAYKEGSLFCCVRRKGIKRFQLENNSISTIVIQDKSSGSCYITLHGRNIYLTQTFLHTILCCNLKGEKLWMFKDTNVSFHPQGIAVDDSDNVYIASSNCFNVVVLSPDGKKNRQILGQSDGLVRPYAINIENGKLLVVNENGPVFVYKIS